MLVKTIAFEIPNFANNSTEEFLIEFNEDNYEKVLQHRFTRAIRIAKTFDFQFEKEERMPVEFLPYWVWLALLPEIEDMVIDAEQQNENVIVETHDSENDETVKTEVSKIEFIKFVREVKRTHVIDSIRVFSVNGELLTEWNDEKPGLLAVA